MRFVLRPYMLFGTPQAVQRKVPAMPSPAWRKGASGVVRMRSVIAGDH